MDWKEQNILYIFIEKKICFKKVMVLYTMTTQLYYITKFCGISA